MPVQIEIFTKPEESDNEDFLISAAAQRAGIRREDIVHYRKVRKSIDARKDPIILRWVFELYLKNEPLPEESKPVFRDVRNASALHIIGAGPAGMFAALQCLELGIKPVILERGKKVKERRRDLAKINREGIVDPDSNYCFGEGGAGTYSDGKLYTRSKKRGDVEKVLQWFVAHGAKDNILYEAHPHIGTNKLPHIVEAIRETIINYGGEIHFECRLTDFDVKDERITRLYSADGNEFECHALIMAGGHSARDLFRLLASKNILIEAKPFALGVRIEHPQSLIDSIQYHCEVRSPYLPPSSYSLVHQAMGRGVFSFCMCPGGIIAPAATAPGELVVNGWSPSKRNGRFANSGMVVSIEKEDFKPYERFAALAGMEFQAEVEKKAFVAGGSNLQAPAQRMIDFVNRRESASIPETSYLPGVKNADLFSVLPLQVSSRLREALKEFGKKMKGYLSPEAVLVAPESRTSSPVRIPRDKETLLHPQIKNLFPCGEGAGYAGGIVSAAMDGMACAQKAFQLLNS